MMSDYMLAIDNILENSSMSELMTIRHEIMTVSLSGMFYSGIYSSDAPVSYAPKHGVREDSFECSLASIRDYAIEPKDLIGFMGTVRGKEYKVLSAEHGECGTVMLVLKPTGGEAV